MYGRTGLDNKFIEMLDELISKNKGVFDLGRLPRDKVIEEKLKAEYHLYFTNCDQEIDCISIKESHLLGCIPIISNQGVFKERTGAHYNFDVNNPEQTYTDFANNLITDIKNNNVKIDVIEDIQKWNKVANIWQETIGFEFYY